MIMKYDKMIEITQAESQRKMEVAKKAISGMLDNMERITVAELVKRTGLSRGFFYKNQMVTVMKLKKRIRELESENSRLEKKIEELTKELNKQKK